MPEIKAHPYCTSSIAIIYSMQCNTFNEPDIAANCANERFLINYNDVMLYYAIFLL